uniref:Uncharacterized protein n=1 Tax=Siphoviridae sp. ctHip2 TaxID=2827830 RepID=A0A8S5RW31_9CAUD|nr:MAG TPA: hypothetical protein [Siphoviridae sp. ctHip2]
MSHSAICDYRSPTNHYYTTITSKLSNHSLLTTNSF